MIRLAIDCETYAFESGNMLPRIVCMQARTLGSKAVIMRGDNARRFLATALADKACILTGHNIAYDLGCSAMMWPELLEPILDKYEQNSVICTMAHAQLCDFAIGANTKGRSYALDKVCERWGIIGCPDKANRWRLRYGELDDIPTRDWPREAYDYAIADINVTLDLSIELQLTAPIPDVPAQSRWYFWLQLSSALGMLTDAPAVVQWERELYADIAELEPRIIGGGLVTAEGKKVMVAIRDRMIASGNARKTPKGNIITDRLACEESGDELLQALAKRNKLRAAIDRELPMLRAPVVHTHYGMAATTRTTSSNPNMQNLSTGSGSRGCFKPRDGKIYVINDYSILELCTLAEICVALKLGDTLANVLRAGDDPHRSMTSRLLGSTYEDVINHPDYKRTRGRLAKEANYGFPGGMGPATLKRTAAKRGTQLTLSQSKGLRMAWAKQWPELPKYQKWITRQLEDRGGVFEHYYTKHLRGRLSYPQGCNTLFQSLGAVVTKTAGWRLLRAGFLPSLFVHDEFVNEIAIAEAAEAAIEIRSILESTAREILPEIGCRADTIINERWIKP